MQTSEWNELAANHEMAYFRGSLAAEFPESYSIEEMEAISDGMTASTEEVEAAIRADFNAMPVFAQQRMMELLAKADPDNMSFWNELFGLKIPGIPPIAS